MRHQRGQATVELALCLPLVALVLGSVVEIGGLVSDRVRLAHAAREAARVAVVNPNEEAVRSAAESAGLEPIRLKIDPAGSYRRQGEPLTVTITYSPRGRIPLLGSVVERLTFTSEATMRIERP